VYVPGGPFQPSLMFVGQGQEPTLNATTIDQYYLLKNR
jgi:hypothetical protein